MILECSSFSFTEDSSLLLKIHYTVIAPDETLFHVLIIYRHAYILSPVIFAASGLSASTE
jgi:hypothetical protein